MSAHRSAAFMRNYAAAETRIFSVRRDRNHTAKRWGQKYEELANEWGRTKNGAWSRRAGTSDKRAALQSVVLVLGFLIGLPSVFAGALTNEFFAMDTGVHGDTLKNPADKAKLLKELS